MTIYKVKPVVDALIEHVGSVHYPNKNSRERLIIDTALRHAEDALDEEVFERESFKTLSCEDIMSKILSVLIQNRNYQILEYVGDYPELNQLVQSDIYDIIDTNQRPIIDSCMSMEGTSLDEILSTIMKGAIKELRLHTDTKSIDLGIHPLDNGAFEVNGVIVPLGYTGNTEEISKDDFVFLTVRPPFYEDKLNDIGIMVVRMLLAK